MELVFDAAHDVQIRHAGLDHHHVRAFGDVHGDFAQRFIAVARVHLVDLFVALAQIARRAHCVTKRPVKRAGVFGAVGHDAGVDVAMCFQGLTDGGYAPVHHVAGRHDVHAGFGLGERLLHQYFHRFIVQDVTRLVQPTVLAVAGEGVEGHIGHHAQIGKFFFQRLHHARHQAFAVGGFHAVGRFQAGVDDREQGHDGDAQLHAFFGHGQ